MASSEWSERFVPDMGQSMRSPDKLDPVSVAGAPQKTGLLERPIPLRDIAS
jgi:hypothetical protein